MIMQEQSVEWRSKMFKTQAQRWLEMQPKHTQEWLKKQAIWHDRDVAKFVSIALVVGFFFGYISS